MMYKYCTKLLTAYFESVGKSVCGSQMQFTYQEMSIEHMLTIDPDQDRVVNGSDRIRILIAGYPLVVVISVYSK
jgi:hypothetical protein